MQCSCAANCSLIFHFLPLVFYTNSAREEKRREEKRREEKRREEKRREEIVTIVATKYGLFFKMSTMASGGDDPLESSDVDESAILSYSSEAASAAALADILLLSSACIQIGLLYMNNT